MAGNRLVRAAVASLATVALAACGTAADDRSVPAPAAPSGGPAPSLPLPGAPKPAPYVPLPVPVVIPLDGYAAEPVVEYGSIQIPRIGLDHKLYQGVTLHNIDLGPSHWTGTARPGERGNAVVAGHRVTHSQPFLRVDELVAGDLVIFRVDGVRSTYRVTNSMVVAPADTWIADQTHTPTATLYACHPPGSEAQRYVVQMVLDSTGPA
ncbi:MAG: sortase [Acidimicrobiia bacterium]